LMISPLIILSPRLDKHNTFSALARPGNGVA
jgi:hypothetical protein